MRHDALDDNADGLRGCRTWAEGEAQDRDEAELQDGHPGSLE
jgi:hypothetical protein